MKLVARWKDWSEIEQEVEGEMLKRFASVPLEERTKMGIELGSDPDSHEKRQWVQTYVTMLSWKDKCKELLDVINGEES